MKNVILLLLNTAALLFAVSAYSHAPELHKKEGAEKPQCAEFAKMDHSTMDMNDPIVQAMMVQCKDWLDDTHHDDNQTDKPEKDNQKNK